MYLKKLTAFLSALKRYSFYRKRLEYTHAFPYYVFLEVIRSSHHAFVQSSGSYAFIVPFMRSPRRRGSPKQGVLGLSLSRRNEGLGVSSR